MFKTKRYVGFTLVPAIMLTTALTGCTKESATEKASTKPVTTAAATQVAKESLPPVELNWAMPVAGTGAPKDVALVEAEINKYLKDKINATVKMNMIPFGTWADKSNVIISSGESVDILFTAGWSNYRQNVIKGAFIDMTDLIDKYAPKTKAALDPAFLAGSKVNGKNYALPTQKELAHQYGFLYRADIAEKYNMDLSKVKTLDDLEPFLKIIKEKEPNMYPILAGQVQNNSLTLNLDYDPIGDATIPGKLVPGGNTTVINDLATPETKAIFTLWHKYYTAGYMRKDAATVTDITSDRKAGKFFLTIGTLKPLANEEISAANGGFPYKQIYLRPASINGNDTQGSMQAISRTSKNPERAMMFLELLNTDKYLNNLVNNGIEGKHFVKVSDNVIDFAQGVDAQNSGYYPGVYWVFGNQYLNYFYKGQNTTKWDQFKSFNASAISSKLMGFNFDQEPVKTEVAAIANVNAEFNAGLSTGTLDPEVYLPKYLDKLKQAGVDKVIAEKQKQVDAWLAAGGNK
ncbi:hypothetical protein A8709_12990 [Paenibacillus pectinilyticus]|uniref:DUF3502 domain-containing protein n=1 Tax=Paenibacillus pectinilyticus TaxID=512399 RepID=A0A1C1A393_9BACL|nr:ABC transporter substrate-binding protein [Paenibacillus pectinilyticus]OCT15029.1 hypothetical protein A8709_12990 [Paenibacillus pectinilyticus]